MKMNNIKAPYRFIRTHKKIFYPSFGNKKGEDISFDMPYKDSQSGEIEITLTAKSPIFIGDFTSKGNQAREFFNHNGEYYIPGSSIKGMIRNISTILSFSKMSIEDKKLSYRDFSNNSNYKTKIKEGKTHMGWLYKNGKQWIILDCGKLQNDNRIEHDDLPFDDFLIKKIKKAKSANDKYKLVENSNFSLNYKEYIIVFTGSIKGKEIDFLFPNYETYKDMQPITLSNKQIQTFKDAYYIGLSNESKDWNKQWSKRFDKGHRIPIFFQKDSNNQILHFGLSMLYKLPYENSIWDLYKNSLENYDENCIDFTQRIFGYIKDKDALKGRVSFSHFKAQNPQKSNPQPLILSEPRATFYPFYLEQENTSRFKTYDDKDAKLSGFKFYPPKNKLTQSQIDKNNNIITTITPLKEGTKFIGKLRYFNLKKEELGLLLLSLTFLKGESFYKIGGAKPYGYGDCHLELKTDLDIQSLINAYIDFTKKDFGEDPSQSTSAQDLLKYSKKIPNDKDLDYMKLENFTELKKGASNGNHKRENHQNQKNYNSQRGYHTPYKGKNHNTNSGQKNNPQGRHDRGNPQNKNQNQKNNHYKEQSDGGFNTLADKFVFKKD